jgi:hypothetical protein
MSRTSSTSRSRIAVVAVASSLAMLVAACGLDDSSAQAQNHECDAATIGQTTRDDVHDALGDPTITDHETTNGRRVVSDLWVDGTVGFSFDEGSEVLVEKDC